MSGRPGGGTLEELLRGYRFAAGLSQRALTERAKISVRTLRYLEQGGRSVGRTPTRSGGWRTRWTCPT